MTAAAAPTFTDRRSSRRRYEPLLPEFFPVKLADAAIAIDFVVGCRFGCAFCGGHRHPARAALLAAGAAIDSRLSPRKVLAWLRSMPSYRAGVPLRLGHQADAALAFEKNAELVELLEPHRAAVYRTRRPLEAEARAFFGRRRANLLLELSATPRSAALGVTDDPVRLVRSAEGVPPDRVHWVVGPLAADSAGDARRVLDALPPGSRVTLAPLDRGGLPLLAAARPLPRAALLSLEQRALERHLALTEWTCRGSLAEVGRGFHGVDAITGQADLGRRALDLVTCAGCPSRTQCHGELDLAAFHRNLDRELATVGLTPEAPPARTGPRAFALRVREPFAPGDQAFLSHALGQPVQVHLSGAARGDGDPAVLRRWWSHGFLPVTELNAVAQDVLESVRRRFGLGLGGARAAAQG